jgi:acyl-CoA synthetase (NDP forming)
MARLREDVVRNLVLQYGGAANEVWFAEDGAAAESLAVEIGRPVAVKLVADDVVHKSKAGGVLLGVAPDAVRDAAEAMMRSHIERGSDVRGVTVEAMVDAGVEVVVGGLQTPGFGPVVMFGHGGVDVEYLDDVAFAIAPVDEREARALILRTRVGRALAARLPARIDDLVATILAVGGTKGLLENEGVTEVDLNPIVVSPERVVAVDARATELEQEHRARVTPNPQAIYDQLRAAIYPESIAVVGASADPAKMGYRVVNGLVEMGFMGTVVPVSRSTSEVCGLPAVAKVDDLPDDVHSAVVALPASAVPEALSDLARRGVRTAHVYTSDIPPLDPSLPQRGIRVLGPNCMGHYAPSVGMSMIAPHASSRTTGALAVVSQSGTYAGDAVRRGAYLGLQFSFVSSVGNCDDVTPAELLAFCEADPATQAVAFYLEGDEGAEEFFHLARTTRMPVVLLKGGRTVTGAAAAASHTGALASDPQLLVDVAAQAGVLLVDDLDQMLDVLLMAQMTPGINGDGLGLLGSGGGVAVVGADTADAWGLTLPRFGPEAQAQLASFAAPGTSLVNPVDVPVWSMFSNEQPFTGAMVTGVATEKSVDALCAFIDVGTVFDIKDFEAGSALLWRLTDDLVNADREGKPLALVLRSGFDPNQDELIRQLRSVAASAGVAVFESVDRAVAAIGGCRFLARSGKVWTAQQEHGPRGSADPTTAPPGRRPAFGHTVSMSDS